MFQPPPDPKQRREDLLNKLFYLGTMVSTIRVLPYIVQLGSQFLRKSLGKNLHLIAIT
jgi:hypothetical protein